MSIKTVDADSKENLKARQSWDIVFHIWKDHSCQLRLTQQAKLSFNDKGKRKASHG